MNQDFHKLVKKIGARDYAYDKAKNDVNFATKI
jgi:hypothetical protein